MYPKIYLKKQKEDVLKRKHPWIFSGAVKNLNQDLHNQWVHICNDKNEIVATGYYQNSNIAIKILDFYAAIVDEKYWENKIQKALSYRKVFNKINVENNAYRLIFAEADELPGLIIDYYDGYFVMQAHNEFMYLQRNHILRALKNVYGNAYKALYDKSEFTNENDNLNIPANTIIKENGLQFYVNWKEGQKTGFFLDQRDNRHLLKQYVKDKIVLNTFAYSGGFSVYAGSGGATLIHSVDSSAKAIEWCNQNMAMNGFEKKHQSYVADVFEFIKNSEDDFYDMIILDPPAFAKSTHHKHTAIQAYKRLNALALKKIKHGGYIFSFSCSGIIDKYLFYNTIAAACFESNRRVKIVDYLHLPYDHPVLPNFPEGEYLKGIVLYVE